MQIPTFSTFEDHVKIKLTPAMEPLVYSSSCTVGSKGGDLVSVLLWLSVLQPSELAGSDSLSLRSAGLMELEQAH